MRFLLPPPLLVALLVTLLGACASRSPKDIYGRYVMEQKLEPISNDLSIRMYAVLTLSEGRATIETDCDFVGFESGNYKPERLRAVAHSAISYDAKDGILRFLEKRTEKNSRKVLIKELPAPTQEKIAVFFKGQNVSRKKFLEGDFNFNCSATIEEGAHHYQREGNGDLVLKPISVPSRLKRL
jgi:hypothetical protein